MQSCYRTDEGNACHAGANVQGSVLAYTFIYKLYRYLHITSAFGPLDLSVLRSYT
jgi:hypothetical protein